MRVGYAHAPHDAFDVFHLAAGFCENGEILERHVLEYRIVTGLAVILVEHLEARRLAVFAEGTPVDNMRDCRCGETVCRDVLLAAFEVVSYLSFSVNLFICSVYTILLYILKIKI
mgnify:CR=1 FL=1